MPLTHGPGCEASQSASVFQPTRFVWWAISSVSSSTNPSCSTRPPPFNVGRGGVCDHQDEGNDVVVRWQTGDPWDLGACSMLEAGLRDRVKPSQERVLQRATVVLMESWQLQDLVEHLNADTHSRRNDHHLATKRCRSSSGSGRPRRGSATGSAMRLPGPQEGRSL